MKVNRILFRNITTPSDRWKATAVVTAIITVAGWMAYRLFSNHHQKRLKYVK